MVYIVCYIYVLTVRTYVVRYVSSLIDRLINLMILLLQYHLSITYRRFLNMDKSYNLPTATGQQVS